MELNIRGPGSVVVHLLAASGEVLIRRRFDLSGSPAVQALVKVPLTAESDDGTVELVPVVMPTGRRGPEIRFDGEEPEAYVEQRCRRLGLDPDVVTRARASYRAAAAEPAPGFDDAMMPRL